MKKWTVLFKKEWTESVRNFKWLWLPVVFILLGISQPVTSYYFADIMESFGGLPEGAVLDLPLPSGADVLAGTLGQFSQVGFLVLVLAFMGVVAGESSRGTHVLVLVKPVLPSVYLTAKWVHMLVISTVSYAAGFAASVYYTGLLIETLPAEYLIKGAFTYLLWLWFVMTLLICLSSIFNSTAAAAFGTLGTAIVLSVLSMYAPEAMTWSPGMLSTHSQSFFYTGAPQDGFLLSASITIIMMVLLMAGAVQYYSGKEVADRSS